MHHDCHGTRIRTHARVHSGSWYTFQLRHATHVCHTKSPHAFLIAYSAHIVDSWHMGIVCRSVQRRALSRHTSKRSTRSLRTRISNIFTKTWRRNTQPSTTKAHPCPRLWDMLSTGWGKIRNIKSSSRMPTSICRRSLVGQILLTTLQGSWRWSSRVRALIPCKLARTFHFTPVAHTWCCSSSPGGLPTSPRFSLG